MTPRGSPLNKDYEFAPSHPVVRTHPVTGWKSLFAGIGLHVSRINDVYDHEEKLIRDYMMRQVTRNHDGVARMHWTRQACAIWSNVCTLHAATVSCPRDPFFLVADADALVAGHTSGKRRPHRCPGVRDRRGPILGSSFYRAAGSARLAVERIAVV